jgi:tRNA G10  N-methylase Trm11
VDFNSIENTLASASVDRIIADPPWGLFENIGNIAEFYKAIIGKCVKLIKPDGKIVIITARKEELTSAVESITCCSIVKTYHILVSGKKAGVFLIENTQGETGFTGLTGET